MRDVAAFCRKWDMLPAGGTVLCAVSGGRDSMALLHLLKKLAGEAGAEIAAAHFNHRLRSTADRDEDFVRSRCREWGIPFYRGEGDTAVWAAEQGLCVEDAARRLRYAFLEATADSIGAERIATAHHRQDNAETVLLHLLRGTGLRGLGGIAPVRGRIVRPLLETDRADIEEYLHSNRIPFVEDESNTDTAFARNRLRLEVMPLLEELAPGAVRRMAGMAGLLREEEACLHRQALALLPEPEGGGVTLPAAQLQRQEPALARRVIRAAAHSLGVELTIRQTEAVLSLGRGGYLDLPGGLCALRRSHQLRLERKETPPPPVQLREGSLRWGPWRVTVRSGARKAQGEGLSVLLAEDRITGPLTIASWDGTGRLAVENGSRTIKRLFADRGIPVERRAEHPVLLLDGRPAAVFGVAVDAGLRAEDAGLRVTLEREEASAGAQAAALPQEG